MEKQTPVARMQPNPLGSSRMAHARSALDAAFKPIAEQLDKYAVPLDKAETIIDYALQLLVSNRKWNAGRIVRKTVAYFKLKKTTDEAN